MNQFFKKRLPLSVEERPKAQSLKISLKNFKNWRSEHELMWKMNQNWVFQKRLFSLVNLKTKKATTFFLGRKGCGIKFHIEIKPLKIWILKCFQKPSGSTISHEKMLCVLIRSGTLITETYRCIRKQYTWPGLRDEVSEFLLGFRSCLEQKLVRARTREPMFITDSPAEPFEKISLDTVGKFPITPNKNRHIPTVQDDFSKYCIAVSIPDLKATTIIDAVATTFFSLYGAPRYILMDRRGSFISK